MPAHDADLKGSESRLWDLVAQRTEADADKAALDQRIWDLFGEDWAVMFTDLSGFSRATARFGIIHFLQIIAEQKRILLPIVAAHDGILVKIEADSFLILFRRAASALRCALAMQHACDAYNADRPEEEQILLCLGIGHGRILKIGDTDVYGAEVNAASKLGEDTAKAHEILVTESARLAAGDVPGVLGFDPLDAAIPGSALNHRVRYTR